MTLCAQEMFIGAYFRSMAREQYHNYDNDMSIGTDTDL